MAIVYKVKEGITAIDFIAAGYEFLSPEMAGVEIMDEEVVCKVIRQAKKSEPVKYAISMFNHPDWQAYNLANGGEKYFELLGITFETVYTEDGKEVKRVIKNKGLYDYLQNWRIEINFTEKEELWLGFTVADATFPKTFYSTECLDKYCAKEILRLKKLGFIEEFEVNQ